MRVATLPFADPKEDTTMHVRHAITLLAIAGLLVIPATSATGSGTPVASANGSAHWTIPLPNTPTRAV